MLVGWVGLMINDGDHDDACDEENNVDGNDDDYIITPSMWVGQS